MKKHVLLLLVLPACAHAAGDFLDDVDASSSHEAGVDVAIAPLDSGVVAIDAGATEEASADVPEAGLVVDASITKQLVFVSSALYDGNLGGLVGADAKCQALATAANLLGAYKAWLSDTTTSAAQRLTHATTPYVLVDSTVVANDWSGLTSGTLLHAIDLTESGQAPPTGTYKCTSDPSVWSHTDTDGTIKAGAGSCGDWSSTSATATHAGSSLYKSYAWTNVCQLGGTGVCAKTASLYCIEQ